MLEPVRPPAWPVWLSGAVFCALLLAVPLLVSPLFWDQYLTVKWYALEVLAALWLAVEVWAVGSASVPDFLRRQRWAVLALAVLEAVSVFRQGAHAALGPLVERAAVCALVLCAYWSFRRRGPALQLLRTSTAVALGVVLVVGFLQAAGHDPLAALEAGDDRGSLFGNANMGAQYAGLAVLLLLATLRARPRWRLVPDLLLSLAALVWLALLWTRSVLLALGAGLCALGWVVARARESRSRRAGIVAASVAAVVLLALTAWMGARAAAPLLRANKEASLGRRLALWSDTLRMARDHPLGLGTGGFEDTFRAYQATGAAEPNEDEVYRHPHDEYLRLAAEEGLPFVALAAVLALLLARDVRRRRALVPLDGLALLAAWTAFLLVEALFQFPLGVAAGALALALLLGLALAASDDGPRPAPRSLAVVGWRLGGTAVALFIAIGAGFLALSERLYVAAPRSEAAQERACMLDARNLSACIMAAWLRGTRGDLPGSRAELVRLVARVPHYPPAVKLLAEQAQVAGDRAAACVYFWTYDQLFRGRSTVHAELMATCSEVERAAAARRVPSPHYTRFPVSGQDAAR